MPTRTDTPSRVLQDTGISHIELVVATALVASGVMATVALFVQADAALRAARHRTFAAVLARAKLERIVADLDLGLVSAGGDEPLDGAGHPLTRPPGAFRRRWSVTPLAAAPDLLLVDMEVTSMAEARAPGSTVQIRTLRRTP